MRPDTLFFDRSGRRSFSRFVSLLLTVAFLALIGYALIRYRNFTYLLRDEFMTTPMFGLILIIYLVVITAFVLTIRWANCRVRRRPALWAAGIFLVALLPRALALLALRAPAFGGEVFGRLNIRAFFLAENLFSGVICAVSALSAVVVYLIARRLDDGSAPAAGLLFALYPAQVVLASAQPVTQLVLLFALLSVLFALIALSAPRRWRAILFSAASGLSLAVCGIALASVWLVALALGVFWVVLFFSAMGNGKEILRLVFVALTFCAAFFPLHAGVFDSEFRGKLDNDLTISAEPGGAQRAAEAMLDALDWETLQKGYVPAGQPTRLDQNIAQLWLQKDADLDAATQTAAFSASALHSLRQGIRLMDFFYVAGVFLFAWAGGLLRARGGTGDLILLILLVWIGAHLFPGVQAQVRFLGMPFLMLFAAYGFFAIVGSQRGSKHVAQGAVCVNPVMHNLGDYLPKDE